MFKKAVFIFVACCLGQTAFAKVEEKRMVGISYKYEQRSLTPDDGRGSETAKLKSQGLELHFSGLFYDGIPIAAAELSVGFAMPTNLTVNPESEASQNPGYLNVGLDISGGAKFGMFAAMLGVGINPEFSTDAKYSNAWLNSKLGLHLLFRRFNVFIETNYSFLSLGGRIYDVELQTGPWTNSLHFNIGGGHLF